MANKYQLITKLYRTMLVSVTEMPQSQKAFLRSACNNYKCPFDEQVLICAQKPDATAVFEMEKWNTLLKFPLPKVLKTTSGHLPKRNPFRRQCYRQGKILQQTTFKETSVQPQSECDNNRRRQWEQVAKRGQVGFLWVQETQIQSLAHISAVYFPSYFTKSLGNTILGIPCIFCFI